jgi:hypothetical protein
MSGIFNLMFNQPAALAAPEIEMFVVYKNPRDYPKQYVVRRWVIINGNTLCDKQPLSVDNSLDDARRHLQVKERGLTRLERHARDVASILEIWVR